MQYLNHCYRREGRYKATPIDSESYFLACMRYIELNPVRADMVAYSAEYPWSSYRFNALGHGDDLVTPHVEFHRLGADDKERIQWRVEPIARGGDRKSTQFKINRV